MEQVIDKTTLRSAADTVTARAGRSIAFGEPVYNELMNFLIEEAHLLDDGRFGEWVALLADDLVYSMPVRQTFNRKRGDGCGTLYWLRENKEMLTFKAERLLGDSAWCEDPPSRIRRMVTNLRVHETAVPGEYLVQSYLLLQRNSGDEHQFHSFSARRDDIVRRGGEGWQLARRDILVDQAVVGQPNLGFFI
jgi:3-phenylpropionate/cinnamic acid dioxygenase small subunit